MYVFETKLENHPWTPAEQALAAWVTPERRARIKAFHFDGDKRRSLYAGLLCRYALSMLSGTAPERLRFGCTAEKKPYLAGDTGYQFNLSHSGDYVVCAVSGQCVGIDIELGKGAPFSVMPLVFHPQEIAAVETAADRQKMFYRLWTMKEAFFKWTGTGLTDRASMTNVLECGFSGFFHTRSWGMYQCSVYTRDASGIEYTSVSADEVKRVFR